MKPTFLHMDDSVDPIGGGGWAYSFGACLTHLNHRPHISRVLGGSEHHVCNDRQATVIRALRDVPEAACVKTGVMHTAVVHCRAHVVRTAPCAAVLKVDCTPNLAQHPSPKSHPRHEAGTWKEVW